MSTDNKIAPISLDMSLDAIEDLPQFVTLPTGAYLARLEKGIISKDIPTQNGAQPVFELPFTVVEVLEIDPKNLDEGEEAPKPGDISSFVFQRDNTFGMGLFKAVVTPIAKQLGTNQIGALLEGSKGMECGLIITRTFNKDKQRHYAQIKKLTVD